MKHDYSLAHLTVLTLTPPQVVDVAARTGYRYVGLRMTRVTPDEVLYDLARDRALMRETKARLADTGIAVLDAELFRMDPALGPDDFVRNSTRRRSSVRSTSSRSCRTRIASARPRVSRACAISPRHATFS